MSLPFPHPILHRLKGLCLHEPLPSPDQRSPDALMFLPKERSPDSSLYSPFSCGTIQGFCANSQGISMAPEKGKVKKPGLRTRTRTQTAVKWGLAGPRVHMEVADRWKKMEYIQVASVGESSLSSCTDEERGAQRSYSRLKPHSQSQVQHSSPGPPGSMAFALSFTPLCNRPRNSSSLPLCLGALCWFGDRLSVKVTQEMCKGPAGRAASQVQEEGVRESTSWSSGFSGQC